MIFGRLLIFFKINFFQKFFQKHYQSAKQLGSRQNVGPDLCPNCLQRLSAEDKSGRFYIAHLNMHLLVLYSLSVTVSPRHMQCPSLS